LHAAYTRFSPNTVTASPTVAIPPTPGSRHSATRLAGIGGRLGATATGLPDVAQALKSVVRHNAAISGALLKRLNGFVTGVLQSFHFLGGPGGPLFGLGERRLRGVPLPGDLVKGSLKGLGLTLLAGAIRRLLSLVDGPYEQGRPD